MDDILIKDLNEQQKEAVLSTEGPLLVLAGAGSGKTRVITHRIAYLINSGVEPWNILAITFTNKAAKEMAQRVKELVDVGSYVWMSTFHSACSTILRREIDSIPYKNPFTIYDAADSEKLLKKIIKELELDEKKYKPTMAASLISSLKDKLISPREYIAGLSNNSKEKVFGDIYALYQENLLNSNAMDFDDLIYNTVMLLKGNPTVKEKYNHRFKYIHVDEFQDTSYAQDMLIRLLVGENNNICVVGDDDQSIYGWRGANIENILDFENHYPNTKIIRLEQNYRSTGNILDAANSVIANNMHRKGKELWTQQGNGEKITYIRAESEKDEAEKICHIIKNSGLDYSDFAILYRNNALSRALEEALIYNSIPYKIYGGTGFYKRAEIQDIIAYLKVVDNHDADVPLLRIINTPTRGIGATCQKRILDYSSKHGLSFYKALLDSDNIDGITTKARKSINAFTEIIEKLTVKSKTSKVSDLTEELLNLTNYRQHITDKEKENVEDKLDNLEELYNKAVQFDINYTSNEDDFSPLNAFLQNVALVAEIDSYEEGVPTVSLMTIHSAKGLEFNNVVVSGFEDDIFPSYSKMIGSASEMEEERRLCYVAITRAKKKLYLTNSKVRFQHGNYNYHSSSMFLNEIPQDLIEEENSLSKMSKINGNQYVKGQTFDAFINNKKTTETDFNVGDRVRNIKYGKGTVIKILSVGADSEITVDFDNIGEKKLFAKLSSLTKIS